MLHDILWQLVDRRIAATGVHNTNTSCDTDDDDSNNKNQQHPYVWIEDQQLLHLLQNEWNVVEPYDDQGSSNLVCLIDYLSTTTCSGSSSIIQ